jgi:hypothetical protein
LAPKGKAHSTIQTRAYGKQKGIQITHTHRVSSNQIKHTTNNLLHTACQVFKVTPRKEFFDVPNDRQTAQQNGPINLLAGWWTSGGENKTRSNGSF